MEFLQWRLHFATYGHKCRIIGNMCESNIDLCEDNITIFILPSCDSNSIEGFFSPVMRTKERTPRISCIFDVMIFNYVSPYFH